MRRAFDEIARWLPGEDLGVSANARSGRGVIIPVRVRGSEHRVAAGAGDRLRSTRRASVIGGANTHHALAVVGSSGVRSSLRGPTVPEATGPTSGRNSNLRFGRANTIEMFVLKWMASRKSRVRFCAHAARVSFASRLFEPIQIVRQGAAITFPANRSLCAPEPFYASICGCFCSRLG